MTKEKLEMLVEDIMRALNYTYEDYMNEELREKYRKMIMEEYYVSSEDLQ